MRTLALYLLASALLGLIPAAIARRKGQPFIAWWLYGTLLIVIALPHSIILKRSPGADEATRT
jgi:hypothetical protein